MHWWFMSSFLIPCHARLVIPWSSLATGKVSLEVSGIHIEAEGMWSCRIFTGCIRLGSINHIPWYTYLDYIDTCRIRVDIHRSECSIPFFQNCRVPSNKIHFLPKSPRLKWGKQGNLSQIPHFSAKSQPRSMPVGANGRVKIQKKSSSEPCGM